MQYSILFLVDTLTCEFSKVKTMMIDTLEKGRGKWFNTVDEYRQELKMTWVELREIDRKTLKEKVRRYDSDKWREGLSMKTSLRIYSLEKKEIGYEFCYKNNGFSRFLARARINALQLEEHKGRGQINYNTNCKLCGKEKEDLVHFLIKCEKLEVRRNYEIIDKNICNSEERMRKLLYRNKKHQEVGKQIKNLWDLRKKLIEVSNDVTPIGRNVTWQNVNPSLGGLVTGQRKIHHRVVMSQGIGRSTV